MKIGRFVTMSAIARVICVIAGCASLSACTAESFETGEEDVTNTYTSFEEFEASTFREDDTGFYIVDGDIPIYSREELFEFYQQYVATGQLILNTANGVDTRWSDADKLSLTYCVSSSSFGANYAAVAKAMNDATAAWSHSGNVRFIHLTDQDGACSVTNTRVFFNVRQLSGQSYLARAFFPNSTRDKREVIIDTSSFGSISPFTLGGVLRHELGHVIGFRHEHTRPNAGKCAEDNNWRDVTSYDSASVMHYPQCNGTNLGDLVLTDKDKLAVGAIYGRRNGGAENLAYRKGATQSSTLPGTALGASLTVDGNLDGDINHNSTNHTNGEASPWWQVDLGSLLPVGDVVLHNRIDSISYRRLSNFKLLVSKDATNWRTVNTPIKVGARVSIPVNETNRFVKVQLNADGTTRFLHLGEVEVLASRNLAKGKLATQSSTDFGGDAARAVDGNTNGAWGNNSVTHSGAELSPWWQVDLGAIQPVGQVVLYNRTDCCADRLSNFKIKVSPDNINWYEQSYGQNAPPRLAFDINRSVRYVKVQLNADNSSRYLALAEVEVFAARNLALGKTASQSSTASVVTNPVNAIDGYTEGNAAVPGTMAVTAVESAPWWQVDLARVLPVGEVVLYNRTDCCSDLLTKFKLRTSLDGTTWTDVQQINTPVGYSLAIAANRPARFVRIEMDNIGTTRALSLAEVEVIAATNLALGGTATASSTYIGMPNGEASRAIDGNTDGSYLSGSISHTEPEAQAFWRVDLGAVMPIGEIIFYNRTDCCADRLSNFKVQLSEDGATWKDFLYPGQAAARESIKAQRIGRYVRVQLNGTDVLSLAELETYLWN